MFWIELVILDELQDRQARLIGNGTEHAQTCSVGRGWHGGNESRDEECIMYMVMVGLYHVTRGCPELRGIVRQRRHPCLCRSPGATDSPFLVSHIQGQEAHIQSLLIFCYQYFDKNPLVTLDYLYSQHYNPCLSHIMTWKNKSGLRRLYEVVVGLWAN